MNASATALDTHNLVTVTKATKIIKKYAQAHAKHPELAHKIPALMFRGAPGVGKSSLIRSIAEELGIGFVDVRLAQMERVDFQGLPSVEKKQTSWNIPSFWPTDPKSKGIILFDEITSAPQDVQVAAYQIVLDRALPNADYELPPGWLIVAAGNRAIDKAVVKAMSSALANRFLHMELAADAESWVEWGVRNGIHPSVTGFIQYRPALLFKMEGENLEQGWPSPRSWERVSTNIDLFNDDVDILRSAVYGLIGTGVGVEFMEFYRMSAKFDDILQVLTNPKKEFKMPEKADERYAVVSAVIYHLWNGETEAEQNKRVDGFYRILDKLTPDFAALLVKGAMMGNDKVKPMEAMNAICSNKHYDAAAEKFDKAFSQQYAALD